MSELPAADPPEVEPNHCFILFRADAEDVPVAVYTADQREACKADRDHRQEVNPDSHYYVLVKPLNPKATRA